jgi:dihydrofolate synthase/folylpolyglutamate synthase
LILDVAHNVAAAQVLAANLENMPCSGRTLAVFGVLQDKEIDNIVSTLAEQVDHWYACALPVARGATTVRIRQGLLRATAQDRVACFDDVAGALAAAQDTARENDRIVVFGSFYTVSEALKSSEALRTLARC